ncbi:FUSC family protein [Rhizobium sp. ACO-34A]|nr:FUSC family protein [Rhizobium sp. ACO-34A]ATN33881.1 FUSC family protein [Rhizobium sp. ACO-34A]
MKLWISDRVRDILLHALAAAIAAALSFYVARWLFGHPKPIFAAIGAVICLAPGISDHFRQALNLVIGVTIGIVIGEFLFLLPVDLLEIRIPLAVFLAVTVGALVNVAPIVAIQAGVSALLVMVLGPADAGPVRFLDVAVGGLIGALFAFGLFRVQK